MPKLLGDKPTDQDKTEWGKLTHIVRRAELDGLVYEFNTNGKMYVLERSGSAPKKVTDKSSILYLIGVIHSPEVHFLARFNEKAENFNRQ
jgi:hypothetical protein